MTFHAQTGPFFRNLKDFLVFLFNLCLKIVSGMGLKSEVCAAHYMIPTYYLLFAIHLKKFTNRFILIEFGFFTLKRFFFENVSLFFYILAEDTRSAVLLFNIIGLYCAVYPICLVGLSLRWMIFKFKGRKIIFTKFSIKYTSFPPWSSR